MQRLPFDPSALAGGRERTPSADGPRTSSRRRRKSRSRLTVFRPRASAAAEPTKPNAHGSQAVRQSGGRDAHETAVILHSFLDFPLLLQ